MIYAFKLTTSKPAAVSFTPELVIPAFASIILTVAPVAGEAGKVIVTPLAVII